MYWIEFLFSALVIIFAGIRLTTYADKLSDHLKLAKAWIGVVLLGLVTSLPEAITALVAVISLKANDLAIGNLIGSNNFNPLLIVILDIIYRKGSVTNIVQPQKSHKVSAYFAIGLAMVFILEIFLSSKHINPQFGYLSIGNIFIVVIYFVGMRSLSSLGKAEEDVIEKLKGIADKNYSSIKIWLNLLLSAVCVIVGAIWLANSADVIAQETGLGRTFVGTIFLALVTSLPEMVVSISALKMGSMDLAIGNIFGSNMTNMFIVAICGMVHRDGPILSSVSPTHIFTALLGIILCYILMKGIFARNKKVIYGLGWDSLIMLLMFIVGTFLIQSNVLF